MRYIIKRLKRLRDPRQEWKVKHKLSDILAMCIIAILCGARSSLEIHTFVVYREVWFRGVLEMGNGIPGRLTINRVLSLIDPEKFSYIFTGIMQYVQNISKGAIVSLDGKGFYTPTENGEKKNALYMLNAWCNENSTILGQLKIDAKTNEITAIPELLKLLNLKGTTVTIDAIGCQKEIVKQIVKKNNANYLIALKDNQQTMSREMREYAEFCLSTPDMSNKYNQLSTCEKGHGRVEKREYYLFHDVSWFEDIGKWENLNALAMVRSTRQVKGRAASIETRYYITSLTDVALAAKAIRSHWGIENNLHWCLDVVMSEDAWASKSDIVAANLTTLRKLSFSFLRKAALPGGKILSGPLTMWSCALDTNVLNSVLFGHDISLNLS